MELGKKLFDTRYLFHITSIKHPYTGAKADLYIDARAAGNQLRFVNHDSNPNCEAIYVPHDNMWNVIFVAKRDIQVHEEITISYGKSFKSVRGKEIEERVEESGPDDYMDTEWDIKRKEELEARDPNTGKLLKPHMPNKYELEDQKRRILQHLNRQLWKDIEKKYYELGFDKIAKEEAMAKTFTEAREKQLNNEASKKETEKKEAPKEKAPTGNNRFRKFSQQEMSKYFTVDLIHEIEPESYFMKRALKDYDINSDEKMKEHPEEYKVNSAMYGKYFKKDYFKNDDRFYIQVSIL
ncbi:hypothetical protein PIROE2DRAFT_9162 [Piromyces sp. E2]|nr:hypothetical protein PIROE2DRAFT_9162 [Piromyces sp. E2]|eukprot:OUM64127.1 hypothetical protein PIROE2DRAFT_9162 [Piromyces sp. E2]